LTKSLKAPPLFSSIVAFQIGNISAAYQIWFNYNKKCINSELEATKHGWQQYYWNPIKATFGFGSFLTDVL
jgi:hypothetical protein